MNPAQADTTAYLGLGANLGDRLVALRAAVGALDQIAGIRVDWDQGIAPIYETSPVGGPPNQPDFFNTAIRIFTTLDPLALLAATRQIENQLGRERHERWAARTIDIDILLFGDQIINSEFLTVPHPRMHERRFVLAPLCDIAGDMVHPGLGVAIKELYRKLRAHGRGELVDHGTV